MVHLEAAISIFTAIQIRTNGSCIHYIFNNVEMKAQKTKWFFLLLLLFFFFLTFDLIRQCNIIFVFCVCACVCVSVSEAIFLLFSIINARSPEYHTITKWLRNGKQFLLTSNRVSSFFIMYLLFMRFDERLFEVFLLFSCFFFCFAFFVSNHSKQHLLSLFIRLFNWNSCRPEKKKIRATTIQRKQLI